MGEMERMRGVDSRVACAWHDENVLDIGSVHNNVDVLNATERARLEPGNKGNLPYIFTTIFILKTK